MASTISQTDVNSLNKVVYSTLIVRQLQAVLKAEGQPISGLKAHLQRRLQTYIDGLYTRGDVTGFHRVKNLIYRPDASSPSASTASRPTMSPVASGGVARPNPAVFLGYETSGCSSEKSGGGEGGKTEESKGTEADHVDAPEPVTRQLHFKNSPFYEILTPLSDIAKCPAMNSNRHSIKTVVSLSANQVEQLATDKSYRCMVYCAAIEPLSSYTKSDIAFPYQVELRINDTLVTGVNLRGLKNKPGSTRPCDITEQLVKKAGYRNEVGLTYALTQKEFGFIVNFVKTESVDNLVSTLQNGKNYISKETVVAEMMKSNEDSDLVATSTVMSLKCPVSTLRINVPVRSTYCTHPQCFDACSYLQMQQQAPTWVCTICNKSISYSQLVVDRYFDDILNHTPKTVESVTIDPNGKWTIAVEASNSPVPDSSDDEHDIVEIRDTRDRRSVTGVFSTPRGTSNGINSPNPSSVRAISHKRPVSEVIDLTLSDDDDEPPRRTKRMAFAMPTPTSLSSEVRTNGFHLPTSDRSTPNGYSPVWTMTPDPPFPTWSGGGGRYQ